MSKDGSMVYRSTQLRLLEQVGGLDQKEIFSSNDDPIPLALQAQRFVSESVCSKGKSTALAYDARLAHSRVSACASSPTATTRRSASSALSAWSRRCFRMRRVFD